MVNTPNIRFKGFTDDWEQRKFSDVVDIGSGMDYKHLGEGDIPVYGTGGYMLSVDAALSEDKDAIGIGRKGTIDKPYILRAPFWTVDTLFYCIPKDGYDLDFTSCLFQNVDWKKKDESTGVPSLSKVIINNVETTAPSYEEQRKIGDYFKGIDNLITLQQRKCDETKELKKYMLQKMFPKNGERIPEIRFEGFTDDWEQRKLGDFGKATGGTSIESEFSEGGKYKVISIGSYSEDSIYRDQGIRAIESEKTKIRVLNKDDLTMILNDKTSSGNIIGRVLLIEESGVYVYNQRTERIEVDHDNYDSLFIYEMLNAPQIRDKIVKQSQGNTQIYVNWSTIAETGYLVPQIDEQRCLGEFFSNLDNLITLHQRKCDEIKELKKYMLQNMFV